MIKFEHTETFNWEGAIRGMRNPMNSWEMSDSEWEFVEDPSIINPHDEVKWVMGENDLDLAKRLAKAGSDHRKFMRQIFVSVDITAPLYWWKEFDTYKVGTTANSCSTMHKIHTKKFEMSDFGTEHLTETGVAVLDMLIGFLENWRLSFNETKDKAIWYDIISILPSTYLQKRTVTMNYENLVNMYHARKNHKLDEWHTFCDWIKTLPYSKIITGEE